MQLRLSWYIPLSSCTRAGREKCGKQSSKGSMEGGREMGVDVVRRRRAPGGWPKQLPNRQPKGWPDRQPKGRPKRWPKRRRKRWPKGCFKR
eukprot:170957-Chlamydomonas_euryale.AAC.13